MQTIKGPYFQVGFTLCLEVSSTDEWPGGVFLPCRLASPFELLSEWRHDVVSLFFVRNL